MIVDLQCSRRTSRYHRFLTPSGTRWLGTSSGASDPYPDFTGVNNVERMKHRPRGWRAVQAVTARLDWLDNGAATASNQQGSRCSGAGMLAGKAEQTLAGVTFRGGGARTDGDWTGCCDCRHRS